MGVTLARFDVIRYYVLHLESLQRRRGVVGPTITNQPFHTSAPRDSSKPTYPTRSLIELLQTGVRLC